jgi:hypothetical protein
MKVKYSRLPLKIEYVGCMYATKTIKCAYSGSYVVYKVALPSAISQISQCWFARHDRSWKPIVGQYSEPELLDAILLALQAIDTTSILFSKIKKRASLISA